MDLDFAFSKLPCFGRSNMATTLKAFCGPTLLMFLNRHDDFQSCNFPFFSSTCVWVCGMNIKSVIEMTSERRCHYYVFGSLLQSLPWLGSHMATTLRTFCGPTLLMFFEKHNDSQSCNSPFLSCKCAWVFFTICKIRPFLSIMYLRLFLQSYHGLEAIYYIESFQGTYIC